jgi:hypothetical protein
MLSFTVMSSGGFNTHGSSSMFRDFTSGLRFGVQGLFVQASLWLFRGLNTFVGKFSLPILLFLSLTRMDLTQVAFY